MVPLADSKLYYCLIKQINVGCCCVTKAIRESTRELRLFQSSSLCIVISLSGIRVMWEKIVTLDSIKLIVYVK